MKQSAWRFAVVIFFLSCTLAVSKLSDSRMPDKLLLHLENIPLQIGDWSGEAAPRLSDSVESRLLATDYLTRMYRRQDREMSLLVTYYSQQESGETMHSPRNCLPGAGWEAWDYKTVTVPVGSRNERVNLYSVQKDGQRMQVLYWYQSRARVVANEYVGKVFLVWDALMDGRTGGALVRLMMADSPGAVQEEIRFAAHLLPEVQRCLGRTSD